LVSAKYQLKILDIGQNIGLYRPFDRLSAKYRLRENIGIGIGGQYLCPNISVSVSAKISARNIYIGIGIGWTHIGLSLHLILMYILTHLTNLIYQPLFLRNYVSLIVG
jgi:hypothetical protein